MLSVIKLILGVALAVAQYLQQKNLIEAGEAKAINAQIQKTIEQVDKANAARAAANGPSGVRDDPNNRD